MDILPTREAIEADFHVGFMTSFAGPMRYCELSDEALRSIIQLSSTWHLQQRATLLFMLCPELSDWAPANAECDDVDVDVRDWFPVNLTCQKL